MAGSTKIRSWLATLLLLAVAGGATYYFVRRAGDSGFDVGQFLASFRQTSLVWLTTCFAFSFLSYYIRGVRWAVMLEPLGRKASHWRLFQATTIGFAAIALLGRPGEFVRPYLVARQENVPVASQIGAWTLERIYDLLLVLMIFGFSLAHVSTELPRLKPPLDWFFQTGGLIAGGLGAACVLALILLHRFARQAYDFVEKYFPTRFKAPLESAIVVFESTGTASRLTRLLLFSVVEWLAIIACYLALVRSFPPTAHLDFASTLAFLGFVAFGSTVQIPGVGGGMQIVCILVLTELFGVELEPATSFALLVWFMSFVIVIPVGLWFALRQGFQLKGLARSAREGMKATPP